MRINPQAVVYAGFCLLGPIGALIPVPGLPSSFRFYYALLPIGIVVFACRGINRKVFTDFLIMMPVVVYMVISAGILYAYHDVSDLSNDDNPIVRVGLFTSMLLFALALGSYLWRNEPRSAESAIAERVLGLRLVLLGYVITLAAGYVFFVGYYLGVLSVEFIDKFQVLTQFGYGLLRFSPGSYPNEYGIVSSFMLSIWTLLIMQRIPLKQARSKLSLPMALLGPLYILTLAALFLTTTRAAYVAYVAALAYLVLRGGTAATKLKRVSIAAVAALVLVIGAQSYYDVLGLIEQGIRAFSDPNASAASRFVAWRYAWLQFCDSPLVGTGFGSQHGIHNTYLQFFFELGVLGSVLIGIAGLLLLGRYAQRPRRSGDQDSEDLSVLRVAKNLALLHVLWFAMSNHNLNHFLTWLCVLLMYMSAPPVSSSEASLVPAPLSGRLA
ncbi:MAG: O-antigen ligase family protein [Pseudomonadota bacterium]|nr:O-antigen ligase family protein [Pseudomonadota bacterium]